MCVLFLSLSFPLVHLKKAHLHIIDKLPPSRVVHGGLPTQVRRVMRSRLSWCVWVARRYSAAVSSVRVCCCSVGMSRVCVRCLGLSVSMSMGGLCMDMGSSVGSRATWHRVTPSTTCAIWRLSLVAVWPHSVHSFAA